MSYYRQRIIAFYGCLIMLLLLAVSCGSRRPDAYYEGIIKDAKNRFAHDWPAGKQYLDSVYRENPDAPPGFKINRFLCYEEWSYLAGLPDISAPYLDSQLALIAKYGMEKSHRKEYIDALNHKGDTYYRKNNLDKAFEYYSQARRLTHTTTDSCAYVNPSYTLGMVSYKQKKFRNAISFFQEAFTEIRSCPWEMYIFFRQEELLLNIGLSYSNLKLYDSSKVYFDSALHFIDKGGRLFPGNKDVAKYVPMATGVIKGNIAKVYIAQEKLDSAVLLLQENIAINDENSRDKSDAMYSRMQLAEVYFTLKKYDETISELNKLQYTLDTIPNNDIRLRSLHLRYEYENVKGDAISAATYFDKYKQLSDSLEMAAAELKKTDYAQLLKDKDNEYRIALLTKDNELSRVYLGIAVLLSLLGALIIALVYRNYNRSRKNVVELTSLNHRVNEQKEELETTMEQLRDSNSAKDRILHVVAHDLRNPVSGVIAMGTIMKEEEELGDEHRHMVTLMITASESAMALIDEILEYSDMKRKPLAMERGDINEIIDNTVGLLQLKANTKNQKINLVRQPQPVYILAHKEKINRVLGNLLANAIKFSNHNAAIDVRESVTATHILIEVKDNGIGIPAEDLPHVFDLFTSSKRYGTDGETSFGLGLSICEQIVAAHNGRIWVESTEGKGSSFFIELPLAGI